MGHEHIEERYIPPRVQLPLGSGDIGDGAVEKDKLNANARSGTAPVADSYNALSSPAQGAVLASIAASAGFVLTGWNLDCYTGLGDSVQVVVTYEDDTTDTISLANNGTYRVTGAGVMLMASGDVTAWSDLTQGIKKVEFQGGSNTSNASRQATLVGYEVPA